MQKLLLHFFFSAGFILFAACPNAASEEHFSVGVIIPLTGPLAGYGDAIQKGLHLAQEDFNNLTNGCHIHFENSQYETKTAITAFRRLTQEHNVNLVYVFGGPMTEGLVPLVDSSKCVLISSENEARFAVGQEYVIRMNSPSEDFQRLVAQYAEKQNWKKIALVRTENQFINGMVRAFKAVSPPSFVIDEIAVFQPTDSDVRTAVLKLKNGEFDVVGTYLLPGQLSQFYRSMSQQKVSLPSISSELFEDPQEQKSAGPTAVGTVYTSNPVTTDFETRYEKTFPGAIRSNWAGMGYELGTMISKLFCGNSGKNNQKTIVKELRTYSRENGVFGNFKYVETADGDKYFNIPPSLRQVTDKKAITLPGS